jgi:hypothetical protein
MDDVLGDPKTLAAVVSAAAACVAACFTYLTARRSARTLRLAEQQELRRRPHLDIHLGRGRRYTQGSLSVYTFLISVGNTSDNDNSIARLDLRVEYRTKDDVPMSILIPLENNSAAPCQDEIQPRLSAPVHVDAHQTIAGWACFHFQRALLDGCNVDTFTIVATDSHGQRATAESIIIQEEFGGTQTAQRQSPCETSVGAETSAHHQ